MKRKSAYWVGLIALIAALLPAPVPTPVHAQDDVTWLLSQINALRASLGLHPYALNGQLSAAAQHHSAYMAETCEISHVESDGSRPADRAAAYGYTGGWISENIYAGNMPNPTAAWDFWIHSPVHYAGLTHQVVNEVGIGAASGACGWHAYTLLFGHRDGAGGPPAPAAQPLDSGGSDAGVPAAPPPTQKPYVPPPPSSTPTATIETFTPSPTWTLTPTWTASPEGARPTAKGAQVGGGGQAIAAAATGTPTSSPTEDIPLDAITPTGTPLIVATRSAPDTPTVTATPTETPLVLPTVPALPTDTLTAAAVSLAVTRTPSVTPAATRPPETVPVAATTPANDGDESGTDPWLAVILFGGALLLGVGGFMFWRRPG